MLTTYPGHHTVDILHFTDSDVDILDIAHSLSLTNRFGGHVRQAISVAQHSVYVSRLCAHESVEIQLQALLHDASEAYIGDVVKWLKAVDQMAGYRLLEERIQNTVYRAFGLPTKLHPTVEEADRLMVRFEAWKGYDYYPITHPDYPPPTPAEIDRVMPWAFWSPKQAEEIFLATFRVLTMRIP